MNNRQKPRNAAVRLPNAANDNQSFLTVTCDLPERLGIIQGETELIARHLDELLQTVANDNDEE